jgi:hypothetical protein
MCFVNFCGVILVTFSPWRKSLEQQSQVGHPYGFVFTYPHNFFTFSSLSSHIVEPRVRLSRPVGMVRYWHTNCLSAIFQVSIFILESVHKHRYSLTWTSRMPGSSTVRYCTALHRVMQNSAYMSFILAAYMHVGYYNSVACHSLQSKIRAIYACRSSVRSRINSYS